MTIEYMSLEALIGWERIHVEAVLSATREYMIPEHTNSLGTVA